MSLRDIEANANYESITVAQPAAGAEWSFTVPAGNLVRFECLFFTLTTSAAVANRIMKLQIKDASANIVWEGGHQTTILASQTGRYGPLRLGGQAAASGSNVPNIIAIPDLWLPAGYVLVTSTSSIDVADQYSAIHGLAAVSSSDWS